jgi:hypothetical protein
MFAMGADTPVFNNEAVDAWNGFPVMKIPNPKQFDGWIDKYNPVVRMVSKGMVSKGMVSKGMVSKGMVSKGDGELEVHSLLRKMLIDTPPFNTPFVKMHFNLVVGLDAIYLVNYEATLTQVELQDKTYGTHRADDIRHVTGRFGTDNWYGLVTRTQRRDVADLEPELQRDAMCAFLRVLLRIDGRMIHADLHRRNMAIMYDGKPVIHDVGRMKIRDAAEPGAPRDRILRNDIYSRFDNPNYYMSFSQHFYIARMFKKIRKMYGEVFPKPTAKHDWVQDYVQPTIESEKKFKAWLDAKATGSPDDKPETNYVQVARVYDILSVLKGLSDLPRWTAAGQPAKLTAYYYARKAAVTLTNHLLGGYATKENVTKIVRGFLELSGTMGQCGGKPAAGENPEDPEDRYAATYMPNGEFSDDTRGNKGAVAAPPAPAPPAPAPPAQESVDLRAVGQAEIAVRAQEDALNQARIESLPEGDELSAIRAVTETPPEVAAAAAAAGDAEDDKDELEVALETQTEDKSAAEKVLAEYDAALALAHAKPEGAPVPESPLEAVEAAAAPLAPEGGRMEGGVFKGDNPPSGTGGPMRRDRKPLPGRPYGGRRTPRRKGLPQLL